jgi:Rod binding domain-containing protein
MRAIAPMAATKPGANTGAKTDPRLKPAAHEFEACLMKEFLAPLQRDSLFDDGTSAASSDGSDNALMGFGSEALARAISDRGGFGIATKIIGQLGGRAAGDSEDSLKMERKK